jgi:hypothetical protein
VKFFITNQEEDRRTRRAAAVEWTLAGSFSPCGRRFGKAFPRVVTYELAKQFRELGIVCPPG